MKITGAILREMIREEVSLHLTSALNEKLATLRDLSKGVQARGTRAGAGGGSVSGTSVEPTKGVDKCWDTLGSPIGHGCNFDAFTVGGVRNYRSGKPGKPSPGSTASKEVLEHLRDKWKIKRVIDLTQDSSEEALVNSVFGAGNYMSSKPAGKYSKPGSTTWAKVKQWLSDG